MTENNNKNNELNYDSEQYIKTRIRRNKQERQVRKTNSKL